MEWVNSLENVTLFGLLTYKFRIDGKEKVAVGRQVASMLHQL